MLLPSFMNVLGCSQNAFPPRTGVIYQKLKKVILMSKIDTAEFIQGDKHFLQPRKESLIIFGIT